MTVPSQAAPRRYFVDAVGRRVLIGLTIDETQEFEDLDREQAGHRSVSDMGEAAASSPGQGEQRWLVLYEKHESAWRSWMVHASICSC
jgi:hypothetical protein